ncbi:AFR245Wp [Eremothecium gossypii ATCC 10895]|uniref:AFR245Wp n=1 Tax=Eremothecium gossypii (strain ATCC 10895 / CBS 109.51 / FGSC 9923 / NRRL Y-1056) TaxID=284811 RepID=Q753T1_EREGS|nr:AFR245Wp [Eremothecium gossypii ATCC 10895]AAS53616.2 AFR245Wp [Eremothecium gossypii ATCC 10895]AEY97929.1 FAFR245Wp [Eremothecium gossypii FDAG1]
MSFWPFGQNVNNSNINRILDDYFRVLHSLEEDGAGESGEREAGGGPAAPAAGRIVKERSTNGGGASGGARDSLQRTEGGDAMRPVYHNPNSSEQGTVSSAPCVPSALSSAVSICTEELADSDEAPLTKFSLNYSFIDSILKESELLNELTRQNNTLLDFVCFGFFYDTDGNKIDNIEYLIDQLMFCIDRVNEEQKENDETRTPGHEQENEQHDDFLPPQQAGFLEGQDSEFIKKGVSPEPPSHEGDDAILPFLHGRRDTRQSSLLNRVNTISEIFALDIWLISESLVKDPSHLSKIWSVLNHKDFKAEKSPLVPIFLKINQNLLLTRQDQLLNFIRARESLVDEFLQHLEISVLMDFFLKIISTDKQESPTGIIELVYDQGLIPKMLSFLDNHKYSADIQACAGDLMKALISISTNAPLDELSIGPNALTRQLCSEESIDCFLDAIINKRGHALTTAVSVVIELIRKNNSDYDQINLLCTSVKTHPPSTRDPIYLGRMLKKFAEKLPNFKRVLLEIENDGSIKDIRNQLGIEYKPLGFERFKIVELIAELLHCSNMGLMNSKKAERIVKERDEVRNHMVKQLQDALTELNMNDGNDRTKGDEKGLTGLCATNTSMSTQTTAVNDNADEEIDESFEIPYLNMNQNSKLRHNPTIGDLFKIQLYDTQLLPKIIQLFIEHPWNNFWHNVVFDIIQQIFNGRMDFSYNSFLVYSLFNNKDAGQFVIDVKPEENRAQDFTDFAITRDLVLQGYKNSHAFYEQYNTNLGYMGHLVLIAEEIVKFSKVYKVELISPDIHRVLQDPDWIFYSEDALNDTRMMYSKILGGSEYLGEENGCTAAEMEQLTETGENLPEFGGKLSGYSFSTQADLHQKLKEKLIKRSQEEVDLKNKKNGVIILGPPPAHE